jgi:RNA polymerase sigma factor (sigma-70 family)
MKWRCEYRRKQIKPSATREERRMRTVTGRLYKGRRDLAPETRAMGQPYLAVLLHRLRERVGSSPNVPDDARLLDRFVAERDEEAFRVLVERYQHLVLGVCRRVLSHEQDAEDAFQATFLVLARKGGSVARRGALPGWLYSVAYRCALRARERSRLRHRLERSDTRRLPDRSCLPAQRAVDREMQEELDAEIGRLPEHLRTAVVLCWVEGQTYAEAARHVGWPIGTVSTRLRKARELLQRRLLRRGLTLSAGALASFAERSAHAAPARLLDATLQLVAGTSNGTWGAATPVALAEGELRTMLGNKLALIAAAILTATALGLGLGPSIPPAPPNARAAAPVPAPRDAPVAKDERQTEWLLFRGNSLQTGVAQTTLPDKLEILWTFKAKDSIENAPAVAKGVVYAGAMDEHLYALDLVTGAEKWKYRAGKDAGFKASPAVKGDTVYVGDTDGLFHAIDIEKGTKRWTFETGAEITSGANFTGNRVLFGSGDETLYCLTTDGKKAWTFKVPGGPVMATPAVVDGRTFVAGCDSALHVIDLDKGTELASVELAGQVGATAAVINDRVYVGTMVHHVQAVDWKNAKVDWTFEPEKGGQPFAASIAATDKLIIGASRDKRVYALDRATGERKWDFLTRGRIESSPVVVGRRVYVGSGDRKFYVLDLATGKEIQQLTLDDEVTGSPAVAGDRILIGTRAGTLYCLGAKK